MQNNERVLRVTVTSQIDEIELQSCFVLKDDKITHEWITKCGRTAIHAIAQTLGNRGIIKPLLG